MGARTNLCKKREQSSANQRIYAKNFQEETALRLIMYLIKHKCILTIDSDMIYVHDRMIWFPQRTTGPVPVSWEIAFRTLFNGASMQKNSWDWTIKSPGGATTSGVVDAADAAAALNGALGSLAGIGLALAHGIEQAELVDMPGNTDVRRMVGARGCEILVERIDQAAPAAALLWHYTAGHKLPSIREACALRPNGAKVAPNERPVLWFSADAVYEPTAIKLVQMPGLAKLRRPSVAEMHELVGVFRFAIDREDARLAAWPAVHRRARISQAGVANMIRAGVEIGAKPMNWFGAFEDIPLANLRFEAWTGQRWVTAEIDGSIEQLQEKVELVRSVSAAAYGSAGIRQAWQDGTRTA